MTSFSRQRMYDLKEKVPLRLTGNGTFSFSDLNLIT
ncbi:hypothetical protein ABIE50_002410 [Chitinophaga sp. OAE865]